MNNFIKHNFKKLVFPLISVILFIAVICLLILSHENNQIIEKLSNENYELNTENFKLKFL